MLMGRRRSTSLLAVAATFCVAGLAACAPATTPLPESTPTASAPEPSDAGFVAFGDGGTADATQQQVADQMTQWVTAGHRVDALVEAGDNVYPDGDPSRYAAAIDSPYAAVRNASRPLWVALGNHDVQAGHGDAELTHLGLPALPFSKTLAGVQLLFLDSNNVDAAQAAWLDSELSAPGPPLRVVVFHHPAYSCANHGSTASVISTWVPILEAHRVALVLNGHDHYYERFRSGNDVTYAVTGGGGAALYARNPACTGTPGSQATATRHHFLGIEVRGSTLTLTAVARTGETLDQVTITR